MKKSIIQSILIYISFWILAYLMYKIWSIEKYKIHLILWLVLISIKDILIYFFEKKKTLKTSHSFKKVINDFDENNIWFVYIWLFINRNYLFPVILTIYMIFLLIWQTKIFNLNDLEVFKLINSNILLWITIFSWILTIFKEDKDNKYKKEKITYKGIWSNLLLTVGLSILWTYIIYIQTMTLWFLSYPTSMISGILIFLVWISILDDDEKEAAI